MIDVRKNIRIAVETGKVYIGSKHTIRAIMHREAKLVIVAKNCPEDIKEDIYRYAKIAGIPVYEFDGTSLELGSVCGRPHVIAALAIIDPGASDILKVVEGGSS